jgi:hypothetical protein
MERPTPLSPSGRSSSRQTAMSVAVPNSHMHEFGEKEKKQFPGEATSKRSSIGPVLFWNFRSGMRSV